MPNKRENANTGNNRAKKEEEEEPKALNAAEELQKVLSFSYNYSAQNLLAHLFYLTT
jgi:hypothetical protein